MKSNYEFVYDIEKVIECNCGLVKIYKHRSLEKYKVVIIDYITNEVLFKNFTDNEKEEEEYFADEKYLYKSHNGAYSYACVYVCLLGGVKW